jgi:hypothetical protein
VNFLRLALAALGGFIAYMAIGGLSFAIFPSLKDEFSKYPAVYRDQQGQMGHMPAGMAAMFWPFSPSQQSTHSCIKAILPSSPAHASARCTEGSSESSPSALLSSITMSTLNIGLAITLQQSAAYFVEWLATGIVIGLIYRPVVLQ